MTGTLRSGDYQIGSNSYAPEGYPAAVLLYRDATFELAYLSFFDRLGRTTQRQDRAGIPIDTPRPSSDFESGGNYSKVFLGWNQASWAPILNAEVEQRAGGGFEESSIQQNAFFEDTRAEGIGGGFTGWAIDATTRDNAGRPTSRSTRFHAAGAELTRNVGATYGYFPNGRVSHVVDPVGTHDFVYDARGMVQTHTVDGEGTYIYGYDELGRNSYLEFPDGHIRRQLFDDLGRTTSRCYDYGGGTERCYTASYDAVGNPVTMTDPDGSDVIEYDGLDRLARVTRTSGSGPGTIEDYAYNALGALRVNAGVVIDHQRPRRDGGGLADAAVPATLRGLPVTMDPAGSITSLAGTTLGWSGPSRLYTMTPPSPGIPEFYAPDTYHRRVLTQRGNINTSSIDPNNVAYSYFAGANRVATIAPPGAIGPNDYYLYDGIDHPLRIKRASETVYYELDLAGNVRALRASGGANLGGYRYTAFGKTLEDSATTTFDQPLRWKGRIHQNFGGVETYDMRARQWCPELGSFLSIDEYRYHDARSTLWGWPRQNPIRFRDPSGRSGVFVWSSVEQTVPVSFVKPGVEYVALAGLDSNVPGTVFNGGILAGGVELGGEADHTSLFYGVERTSDGHVTPISLFGVGLGLEGILGGLSHNFGVFNTDDSFGIFFGPKVALLGEHAGVGAGISISKSWLDELFSDGTCKTR